MKKTLLSLLLLAGYCSYGQFTTITDVKFENKLIALGIDSGVADGKVLTSAAAAVDELDVSGLGITDLTGIQAFTSLTILYCEGNQLTSLDFTNNMALNELHCDTNKLTSLNVAGITSLEFLWCDNNLLTSLDVSTNTALRQINCSNNNLTSLDVSPNTNLGALECKNNQLTSLNVKNGLNDTWMPFVPFFTGNPNLTCIQVDDATYADESWVGMADPTATYSTDCSTLSTEEKIFDKIALYPNPVNSELHINNLLLNKATVYNALGQLVKTVNYTTAVSNNVIDLSGLPKGIYYLYMESGASNAARKIVVE